MESASRKSLNAAAGEGRSRFGTTESAAEAVAGRPPPCDSKADNGDICVSFDIGSAVLAVSPKTSRLDAAETRRAPT